jgi:hypothetical protein
VGLKKNDIVYLTLLRSHYLRAAGAKIHKKCSLKSDLEQCHSIRSRRPTFYLTGPAKGPSFDRAPFDGRAPVRPRFDILTPPDKTPICAINSARGPSSSVFSFRKPHTAVLTPPAPRLENTLSHRSTTRFSPVHGPTYRPLEPGKEHFRVPCGYIEGTPASCFASASKRV